MTPTQQLWATIAGGLGALFLALVPLLVQVFRTLTKSQELKDRQIAAALADLESAQAKRAAYLAHEARAADGLTGAQAAALAEAEFRRRVPGASPEQAAAAVRAAVGELPGLGASGKADTVEAEKPIAIDATVKEIT